MATETTNFGLTKDASTDYYNIDTANSNLDKIDRALGNTAKFETAGGTGTAIILTGIELEEGHSKTFVVNANNNGVATTINGKNLYKPGTTQAPKLIAGKAVTVWYNGTHFFIKASAEGDAIAENVLAEKTFSNDDDTGIAGTMVNNGPVSAEIIDLSIEGAEYTIPKGFHSGFRKIRAKISGLVASVIKAGTTVGGVIGTFTSDATAVAGDILSGKTAYKNGSKLTGTMVDRGTVDHSLAINGSFTIPSGKHSGTGKVTQSVPTKEAETFTPGTADKTIAGGQYLRGAQTILGDPNLIPANILSGKNIFGVIGTLLAGLRYVSGTITSTSSTSHYFKESAKYGSPNGTQVSWSLISASGLSFMPDLIVAFSTNYRQIVVYIKTSDDKFSILTSYVDNSQYTTRVFDSNGMAPSEFNKAYVSSNAFQLPAPQASSAFTWVAIDTGALIP